MLLFVIFIVLSIVIYFKINQYVPNRWVSLFWVSNDSFCFVIIKFPWSVSIDCRISKLESVCALVGSSNYILKPLARSYTGMENRIHLDQDLSLTLMFLFIFQCFKEGVWTKTIFHRMLASFQTRWWQNIFFILLLWLKTETVTVF